MEPKGIGLAMGTKSEAARRKNNETRSEEYYWYKSRGICPRCGRGYAEPGRVYCGPCYKRIKAQKDRNDPGREKRNAYNRERRARLKAAGICVDCGKRKAATGKTRCITCERKVKESREKWNIRQRIRLESKEVQRT
jgi:hypothetical protein